MTGVRTLRDPRRHRQLALIDVPARRCSLCGAGFGRPNPACGRCELRRHPLPIAAADPGADEQAAATAAAAAARMVRLRELGRRVRVALVGCSRSKREGVHPARALYTGALFRRAVTTAESTCDETWILSARHGLVALERELSSYDEELSTRRKDRALWGAHVLTALSNAYLELPLHLVFLAGGPYVEGVTGVDQRSGRFVSFNAFRIDRDGWTYEAPLRGLDRPARWAWFDLHGAVAAARGTTRTPPRRLT